MTTYKVRQLTETWYEVEVQADSQAEAIDLASSKLMNGEGKPTEDGLLWIDDIIVTEKFCECETSNIHEYWHDCGAEECYALECLDCQAFTTLCEKESN